MSTLVTEPYEEIVPAYFSMSLDELFRVKDPTAWIEFEHGRIEEDEYCRRFFADGRGIDKHAFKTLMRDSYEWMDGTGPLLRELHDRGYEMHALSNYSSWYQLIEEKLELSRYVQWTFVSYHTGLRKPDPEAYLHAARTLEVQPQRCIFVDDRRKNVQAALDVGMRGIVRTPDTAEFRAELVKLGLLGA
jgi:HAD superfamily hydrolase (TIGR01509 family)